MTVVTLRPTSTTGNTGTLTGGASLHAVLSDDSDASYVTFVNGQDGQVHLTDLALPAGAALTYLAVRARTAKVSSNTTLRWQLFTGSGAPWGGVASFGVSWISPLTATLAPSFVAGTDAQVDDARLSLDCSLAVGLRVYEAYVDATYVLQPTVAVTAPSGTVANTNRPPVQYTATLDADGGSQSMWQIKIFTAAQYGAGGFDPATSTPLHDSGIQQAAPIGAGWYPPSILPDGAYRAYVRVAQSVVYWDAGGNLQTALWSGWSFSAFTVAVALPAVPTLTLTAQNAAGRVKVDVAANAGPATTDALEIERSGDGGVSWVAVRTQQGDTGWLTGTAGTVYDYEALIGAATQYRARALHNYSGVYAASAWATAATTIDSQTYWVKHPNVPALNLALPGGNAGAMFSYPDVNRAARVGVLQALGAALPIAVEDTRGGPQGTIVLQLRTAAERDAMVALLLSRGVLLLQCPAAAREPDRYVHFLDQSSVRIIDKAWSPGWRDTLPWVEVGRPAGAQTGAQYVPPAGSEELVIL